MNNSAIMNQLAHLISETNKQSEQCYKDGEATSGLIEAVRASAYTHCYQMLRGSSIAKHIVVVSGDRVMVCDSSQCDFEGEETSSESISCLAEWDIRQGQWVMDQAKKLVDVLNV